MKAVEKWGAIFEYKKPIEIKIYKVDGKFCFDALAIGEKTRNLPVTKCDACNQLLDEECIIIKAQFKDEFGRWGNEGYLAGRKDGWQIFSKKDKDLTKASDNRYRIVRANEVRSI